MSHQGNLYKVCLPVHVQVYVYIKFSNVKKNLSTLKLYSRILFCLLMGSPISRSLALTEASSVGTVIERAYQ